MNHDEARREGWDLADVVMGATPNQCRKNRLIGSYLRKNV